MKVAPAETPDLVTDRRSDDDDNRFSPAMRSFILSKKFLIPACLSIPVAALAFAIWMLRPAPAYDIVSVSGFELSP